MKILYGKEYHRKVEDPVPRSLEPADRDRCVAAVRKFLDDPRRPGLNLEHLGRGSRRNHWSMRASQELRVILALEPDHKAPERVGLLNMGHHDEMYAWARRRGYRTDLDEYGVVASFPKAPADRDSATPPENFAQWQLYLPKQQRTLANRHYEAQAGLAGVGRIRGAAGTGKTVVALHRAVVLGRRYRPQRILVTSFSRSLCNHMETLFDRFPDSPPNVEFVNIDKLAFRYDRRPIDTVAVDEAFEEAYKRTVPLPDMERLDRKYMRDEVKRVIKGRGAIRDKYLDAGTFERLGRGTKHFRGREREIAWNLREAWDREMAARGTVDFPDRIAEARDQARELPNPPYRAAVVDEAQDMTQVRIELVRALVGVSARAGPRNDSLLILDDAAQRIYPGGWIPKWAGLEFTRRNSEILRVNYRNPSRIFRAARAVRGQVPTARGPEAEGTLDPGDFERSPGERPVFTVVQTKECRVILDLVSGLVEEGYGHDEIGVLVMRNDDADSLTGVMKRRTIPCVNLKELRDGQLGPGIRVGTFDRAKGLEFRAVLIPRLGASHFPIDAEDGDGPAGPTPMLVAEGKSGSKVWGTDGEDGGQREMNLDRLFVAMTRARDRLYLIADEQPCEEIQRTRDQHFRDLRSARIMRAPGGIHKGPAGGP